MHITRCAVGLTAVALLAAGCGASGEPGVPRPRAASVDPAPERPLGRVTSAKTGAVLELLDLQRTGRGVVTARFAIALPASAAEPWDLYVDLTDPSNGGDFDSVGGAMLVDDDNGRAERVLRDADGQPLASDELDELRPGQRVELFAKFAAPPADTRTVSFTLPTFPSIDGITPGA
jgi:hypothetical protein